jgi:hypothetical protein
MKTYVHLWYLAEFFLEWEIFQTKAVEKIKTILRLITFFRKSCRLWDNVEKYGRARQATGDNIIRRMRFACWITKATDTHSEYVILIAFPRQQWLRERASILRYTYIACLVSLLSLLITEISALWDTVCVSVCLCMSLPVSHMEDTRTSIKLLSPLLGCNTLDDYLSYGP